MVVSNINAFLETLITHFALRNIHFLSCLSFHQLTDRLSFIPVAFLFANRTTRQLLSSYLIVTMVVFQPVSKYIFSLFSLCLNSIIFFTVHKAHKEELENVLYVLEKILLLCPELIANRWQCHSLTRVLTKLLHPGNSWKLRREAVKYEHFLRSI